mmetsp:Transcript_17966/g.29147  ORF Transcript_17966/g.29147 Transcript_17966/m.29147 type:complete len:94 (+) Transcript_17966:515-796(+)
MPGSLVHEIDTNDRWFSISSFKFELNHEVHQLMPVAHVHASEIDRNNNFFYARLKTHLSIITSSLPPRFPLFTTPPVRASRKAGRPWALGSWG